MPKRISSPFTYIFTEHDICDNPLKPVSKNRMEKMFVSDIGRRNILRALYALKQFVFVAISCRDDQKKKKLRPK